MTTIPTYYRVEVKGKTYEGECEVPQSVWDYSIEEFPQEQGIPSIGIPEDPVLSNVIHQEKLPVKNIEVSYFTLYPTREEDQLKYLGWLMFPNEEEEAL